MGRKMGMRGRPGIFFVVILVIFLAIFFLTWKSMVTPKRKVEVKDVYSMNFQSMKRHSKNEHQPHSDLNDVWHRAKQLNGEKQDEQENERDEDYNYRNSVKLNPVASVKDKAIVKSPLSSLLHAKQQPFVKETEQKPYYQKPDESLKIIGSRMDRFIHLDLKGAAPKLSYFKKVFPLFSRLGATGLLIEYEDMFPYTGKLQVISAENSYTKEQIKELLDLAKLNSLQVIPLIQTFGHMEYVLKSLDLKALRETEYTPQVIDISSNESYKVIHDMAEQILEAHPSVKYLHIGCDEVYELGKGKSSDIIVKERVSVEKIFLRHVKRVAEIVAEVGKNKVRPIMWDDELRKIPDEDIMTARLPASVDIMVWRYRQNISDVLTEEIWQKYGRLFKSVWAASSFKGATGPRQLYTEPQHHIINHFSWMDTVAKYGRYVSFKGIALTGWQRFDHFATLCELLPVAIPSLAVCLATVKNGGFNKDIHKTTSSLLGCSGLIEMSFPELDKKERKAIITQDCSFPGRMVYYAVQQLWGYKQFEEQDRRSGWLSDYQINHGFSNPGQLKVLSMRLFELSSKLNHLKEPLEKELNQIYSNDTVEEWLEENVYEMDRELKEIQVKMKTMVKNTHWARRPNLPLVTKKPINVSTASAKADVNIGRDGSNNQLSGVNTRLQAKAGIFNPNLRNQVIRDEKSQFKVQEHITSKPNSILDRENSIGVNANGLLRDSPNRLETSRQVRQKSNTIASNREINSQNIDYNSKRNVNSQIMNDNNNRNLDHSRQSHLKSANELPQKSDSLKINSITKGPKVTGFGDRLTRNNQADRQLNDVVNGVDSPIKNVLFDKLRNPTNELFGSKIHNRKEVFQNKKSVNGRDSMNENLMGDKHINDKLIKDNNNQFVRQNVAHDQKKEAFFGKPNNVLNEKRNDRVDDERKDSVVRQNRNDVFEEKDDIFSKKIDKSDNVLNNRINGNFERNKYKNIQKEQFEFQGNEKILDKLDNDKKKDLYDDQDDDVDNGNP